ncbi:unnamed protein product, partial [Prorocentrum cordatum]
VPPAWDPMDNGALEIPTEELDAMATVTERFATAVQARAMGQHRREFASWARKMWREKPGVLHKCARDPAPSAQELAADGAPATVPSQHAKRRARGPPLRGSIDLAARAQGPRRARGADGLGSDDLQRLPPEGREELRPLLARREEKCRWPRQLPGAIGGVIPERTAGERSIGLLPLVPEIWPRARSSVTSARAGELGAFWGTAVRGPGAPRAAPARGLPGETGIEVEVATATLLLDAETYHDTVPLVKPMALAEPLLHPAAAVVLEAQRSLAPRCLKGGHREHSAQAEATRPVAAGLIDDIVIRCEGSANSAEMELPRTAEAPQDGMDDHELICSNKTAPAASNSELRANLSSSPAAINTPHSAADAAVDLGIDTASSRRRARTEASAHIAAGARRWRSTAHYLDWHGSYDDGQARLAWGPRGSTARWRVALEAGPKTMGALQATLLDMGWDPRTASAWARSTAVGVDEWRLAGADDDSFHACADFGGVHQDVEEDLRRQLWQSAARHAEWGLTPTVVLGGQWTGSRRAAAGYVLEHEGCARRGCADETIAHRICQRPANVGEELESTAALVPRAAPAGYEASPAIRLRGAPASCSTTPFICDERAEHAAVSFGSDSTLWSTRRDDGFVVVYGDGSGGKYSDDPRRRRCATSIVAMGQDEDEPWVELRWFRAVSVPGRRQTVPRAEILGFLLALESVGGDLTY